MLSRDITEDIISIAFAPPGKVLDAQEKKWLVDKFLGAPTQLSSSSALNTNNGAHRLSFAGTLSSVDDYTCRGSVDTAGAPAQRPPMPPSRAQQLLVAVSSRVVTPPISPSETSSLKRISASNATIRESLKKLNLAAQAAKSSLIELDNTA